MAFLNQFVKNGCWICVCCLNWKFAIWSLPGAFQFSVILSSSVTSVSDIGYYYYYYYYLFIYIFIKHNKSNNQHTPHHQQCHLSTISNKKNWLHFTITWRWYIQVKICTKSLFVVILIVFTLIAHQDANSEDSDLHLFDIINLEAVFSPFVPSWAYFLWLILERSMHVTPNFHLLSTVCFLVKNVYFHPIREAQYEISKVGISIRIWCVFTLKVLVG